MMEDFLFISPVSDFNTTFESDFMFEYLTTLSPFEIVTDDNSETVNDELNGLLIIIYGIGGLLIFLIIWSCCYRLIMPNMSDEAFDRYMTTASARSRAEAAAARRNAEENFEEVTSTNTSPNQVNGNGRNSGHRPSEVRGLRRTRGTSVPLNSPQQNDSIFPQRLQNLFRPNTTVKQVCESQQFTRPDSGNAQERDNSQWGVRSQQNVETVLDEEDLTRESCPRTVPTDLCQSFTDQKSSEEDNIDVTPSKKLGQSSPFERQSRSSPSSPDVVRRRHSSFEGLPRLSSSWC